ncbi:hypothetical protein SDC9_165183 [bioreactor metagenome]|uniref:Uncharacterized protein n=1 Tax=bioreactor metagenome TaxID=1076179 RepID=A0A645FTP7_9ZZZZ
MSPNLMVQELNEELSSRGGDHRVGSWRLLFLEEEFGKSAWSGGTYAAHHSGG